VSPNRLFLPSLRLLALLCHPSVVADLLERITHDPAVMGGKPCIRGMRLTVGTILGLLAAGRSQAEILAAYP
jgi:uncharacterized protein (DUF433 family)